MLRVRPAPYRAAAYIGVHRPLVRRASLRSPAAPSNANVRSAADRGQHRQAAGVVAQGRLTRRSPLQHLVVENLPELKKRVRQHGSSAHEVVEARLVVVFRARPVGRFQKLRVPYNYSRGRITILDRATLETSTCECYDAIKKLSLKASVARLGMSANGT